MTSTSPPAPRKTLIGILIMLARAIKALVRPPPQKGMTFTKRDGAATGEITIDLDKSPAEVWTAMWRGTIIEPPHRRIDDVRSGDDFTFQWESTGRGWYWSRSRVHCSMMDPGRRVSYRLLQLDTWTLDLDRALGSDYEIEPDGRGTRLTIRVSDSKPDDTFETFMAAALTWDVARIRRNLDPQAPTGWSSLFGTPRSQSPKPPRRSAVTRA